MALLTERCCQSPRCRSPRRCCTSHNGDTAVGWAACARRA